MIPTPGQFGRGTDAHEHHAIEPVLGRISTAAPIGFEEAIEHWVAHLELRELSQRHILNIRRFAAKAARDEGWSSLDDLTTTSARVLLTNLKERAIKPKTRNEYRSALNQLCDYAVGEGWMRDNPMRNTPRAKVVRSQARRVPSVDEVRRLIEVARGNWRARDRWLVYLTAATTGLRWGQLKGLEWEHARLEADPPHFDLPPCLCKNREASIVWLTAELAAAIRAARGVTYEFVPNSGDAPASRVFRSVPKPSSFDRDLRAAGLAKGDGRGGTFSFHSLRHFASNRMLWVGFSTKDRKEQNQHLTEAMTTEIYTDPRNIELGRKVLAMPDLLPPSTVVTGKNHHDDLTSGTGLAEMSTEAKMTQATKTHDSQAPARAADVILADHKGTRAGAFAPRNRFSPTSKSGRQDSNQSPRSTGHGHGSPHSPGAAGRLAERVTPRTDPLILALESAEAAVRFARALAERSPTHDGRNHHEPQWGEGSS